MKNNTFSPPILPSPCQHHSGDTAPCTYLDILLGHCIHLGNCSSCFFLPISVGNADFPNSLLFKTMLINIFVCASEKSGILTDMLSGSFSDVTATDSFMFCNSTA